MFDASHQSDSLSLSHTPRFSHDRLPWRLYAMFSPCLAYYESKGECTAFFWASIVQLHGIQSKHKHAHNEMMDNTLPWPAALPFPMQRMIWCFHTACLTSAWCGMRVIDWVAWGRVHFTVSSQTPPSSITTAYGLKLTPNCKHSCIVIHTLKMPSVLWIVEERCAIAF